METLSTCGGAGGLTFGDSVHMWLMLVGYQLETQSTSGAAGKLTVRDSVHIWCAGGLTVGDSVHKWCCWWVNCWRLSPLMVLLVGYQLETQSTCGAAGWLALEELVDSELISAK